MATFDFSEAAATQLATIDAKFAEGTAGNSRTDGSGVLRCYAGTSLYDFRYFRYENGHTEIQKSEVASVTGSMGQYTQACIQKTSAQEGYGVRLTGTTIQLDKNGAYLSDAAFVFDPTTAFTLTLERLASNVIKAYVNGVERLSTTDGSPLTGGYPGGRMYCDGTVANAGITSWSDGVGATFIASSGLRLNQAINRARTY